MKAVAKFIVEKKNYIFILFLALLVYCVWGMSRVNVEYSIENYLPAETDTKRAIGIMDEEFVTFGTATVMVRNIRFEEAEALAQQIREIDGVKSVPFENTEDYYRQSCALLGITFCGDDTDARSVAAYRQTLDLLDGRDLLVVSSLVDTFADDLRSDINFVLVLAVAVIVIVLALTCRSLAEIPVFLLTFAAAALLNMGTNFWLGTISFISNSVAVILQLALAIDYAIILSHRFEEEKKTAATDKEAMTEALSKAITEIASSSLTTISGLLALATMALRLGADLGIVLAKSIVCSMVAVFLFMPWLMLAFSKAIDRTRHRDLIPRIAALGKLDVKLRYLIAAVFFAAVAVGCYFSFQADYVYAQQNIDTPRPTETQLAVREREKIFGYANQLAILVPAGEYDLEKQVIDLVAAHDEITEALGISNVEIEANGQTHMLTDRLTYRQVALLLGTDDNSASAIFGAYAFFSGEDTKQGLENMAVFEANKEIYRVSILELCDCAFAHDDFISAYLYDNADAFDTYEELRDTIRDAEDQLIGQNYTRTVYTLNSPLEGKETFRVLEQLQKEVKDICPDAVFAGEAMSCYDLDQSFSVDNLKVSLLTVLFVFVILLFTFRSFGIPLLLALTIQGAIFINFSYYALSGTNLYFFVYLIISAIQMGATIDYAIVFTNRYQTLKKEMHPRAAAAEALAQSFPTILTSGTIMAVAGFLIEGIVSNPLISTMGACLGRGVLISIACVMLVLPALMLIFDKWLDKTAFPAKKPRAGRADIRLFYRNQHSEEEKNELSQ